MNEDYTLSGTTFFFFREPTPIRVTLLSDRVAGEGLETITLTLNQFFGPEDDGIILGHDTTVIYLRDIDSKNIIIRVIGHSLVRADYVVCVFVKYCMVSVYVDLACKILCTTVTHLSNFCYRTATFEM